MWRDCCLALCLRPCWPHLLTPSNLHPSPQPLPRPADRIAATLQLLIFFFISVFIFEPRDFCITGYNRFTDQPGYTPLAYSPCSVEGYGANPAKGTVPVPATEEIIEGFPNFFQLPVLMLMLITLLNDGTLISIGYDNVIASPRPGAPGSRISPGGAAGSAAAAACPC